LRLTSAAVKDADKQALKGEKINTGLRPAMTSFAYRPLYRTEDRGRLLVLFYHSLHRTKPAGQLERISARPVGRE
jgi:hypothetical protein